MVDPEQRLRRLGLNLPPDEYARVEAYARQVGRPVATVARRILMAGIDGEDPAALTAALTRERQRVEQLEARLARVQVDVATDEPNDGSPPASRPPRWRWPLARLLGDDAWWDRWLPELHQLLGRTLAPAGVGGFDRSRDQHILDDRGYADVMRYLFPMLEDGQGRTVPWRSPRYGALARAQWQPARGAERPHRAEVWEPVVRHVALALCALEATSQNADDAYSHMRVQAEIRREWMVTLAELVEDTGGRDRPPGLPRPPEWGAMRQQ